MANRETTVTVTLKVTVDVDAWANEYGTEATVLAVREDVKSYFGNELQGHHLVDSGIVTASDWK
jgi:hypothetical protein